MRVIGGRFRLKLRVLLAIVILLIILVTKTRLALVANMGMIGVAQCASPSSVVDRRPLLSQIFTSSPCDQSKAIFEDILDQDKDQETARFGLALHEFYSNQYPLAAEAFQTNHLTERVSDRIALVLFTNRYHYFRSLGEYDRAIEVIKEANYIYPDSEIPKVLLATVLIFDLHLYTEGRQQALKALSAQDVSPTWEYSAMNLLGWASRYEGKPETALFWFDKATKVVGENHFQAYKSGYAVMKDLQDREMAVEWLERALAEFPNDISFREALLDEWLLSTSE